MTIKLSMGLFRYRALTFLTTRVMAVFGQHGYSPGGIRLSILVLACWPQIILIYLKDDVSVRKPFVVCHISLYG
jgi:hypothetical protein